MQSLSRKLLIAVPTAVTLCALLSGLNAIRLIHQGEFNWAAIAILFAACLDFVDGAIARRLSAETNFGAQFDSLADFVNFGVAPALLLYYRGLEAPSPFAWACATIYVIAVGIRLARFNAELPQAQVIGKKPFKGVPSTGAACAVVLIDTIVRAIPAAELADYQAEPLMIVASILMLSTIPVPRLADALQILRIRRHSG